VTILGVKRQELTNKLTKIVSLKALFFEISLKSGKLIIGMIIALCEVSNLSWFVVSQPVKRKIFCGWCYKSTFDVS
jgi:hypothetical protein